MVASSQVAHDTFDERHARIIACVVAQRVRVSTQLSFAGYVRTNKRTCVRTAVFSGERCSTADLLGDWREEVVWRQSDNKALRVYATTDVTERRIYTLMHDPTYRAQVSFEQSVATCISSPMGLRGGLMLHKSCSSRLFRVASRLLGFSCLAFLGACSSKEEGSKANDGSTGGSGAVCYVVCGTGKTCEGAQRVDDDGSSGGVPGLGGSAGASSGGAAASGAATGPVCGTSAEARAGYHGRPSQNH